jgi:hypothetical protein
LKQRFSGIFIIKIVPFFFSLHANHREYKILQDEELEREEEKEREREKERKREREKERKR